MNARRDARCLGLLALVLAVGCAAHPRTGTTRAPSVRLGAVPAGTEHVVATRGGLLRAARTPLAWAFKGIPYAAPPVGDLRWRPPEPHPGWQGVRDATGYGYACMQTPSSSEPRGTPLGSEDCLTLNVWTPRETTPAAALPVMVYVHGGFFSWGSSSHRSDGVDLTDGARLAARGHVVVVTLNYRLGPLGFVAHPGLVAESPHHAAGNYGLLDQLAALAWVRDNITAFGGDPARVTLFGLSAGAISTAALVASPLSRGLFARALLHSGEPLARPLARAEREGAILAQALGCERAADPVACMRTRSPSAVLAALPRSFEPRGATYGPVVDGWVLPAPPLEIVRAGQHNHVPLVIGTTADEYAVMADHFVQAPLAGDAEYAALLAHRFGAARAAQVLARYPAAGYESPRRAFEAVLGDMTFVCPSRRLARAAAATQTEPVYRYTWTHVFESSRLARLRAAHGLDTTFVFGNVPAHDFRPSAAEAALSDAMVGYWSRFAATGDPNGGDSTPWPRYDPATDPYLTLDTSIAPGAGLRTAQCDFWDGLTPPQPSLASPPPPPP